MGKTTCIVPNLFNIKTLFSIFLYMGNASQGDTLKLNGHMGDWKNNWATNKKLERQTNQKTDDWMDE